MAERERERQRVRAIERDPLSFFALGYSLCVDGNGFKSQGRLERERKRERVSE